ncbi:FkbM family methyltransferase [Phyllobacterium sp. 21LDTY02-6]|uniref:FkbM family methyltransferase n=1 Tax=Phyllobacterium sp. 21LDTY02-6 TaxID=2944903 RepID=UPI002021FA3D|nr:FkbM family methyltransferase [Phyllobacterium sp. 21LDTY02-6]MCO4318287.1 FkbM family methyltransferase [Phyllobacterium sp. 21LDTY02-6]
MTSYNDILNSYRFILGRDANSEELEQITSNLFSLTEIPLPEYRRRFLTSTEFHHRHREILFDNFVPRNIEVLFDTKNGFKIYLDLRQYHITFGIFGGEYEKLDVDIAKAITPDDGVFYDVGGNVGYYSLSVATRPGFTGKVVAFEPLPYLCGLFKKSVKENGLTRRVTVHQLALADMPGSMELNTAEHTANAGATSLVAGSRGRESERSVRVETLDRMVKTLKPDTIKIDIEGAEGLFFEGASATIAASHPSLLVEINREVLARLSRADPRQIHAKLADWGYRLWEIEDGLSPLETPEDTDKAFPAGRVANVLAIHPSRIKQVKRSLASLGLTI